MQKHDFLIHFAEKSPRNPSAETRTHFPNAVPKVAHERLSNGPSVLNSEYISADYFAFRFGKLLSHSRTGSLLDSV
jgi:hypothetical protein